MADGKPVTIDGNVGVEIFATLGTDDDLIEKLRERMVEVGCSFGQLDDILGVEGLSGKYLSPLRVRRITIEALLKLTAALGLTPPLGSPQHCCERGATTRIGWL
jgi:hypothetical protein